MQKNIGGKNSEHDAHYRYKRDIIQVQQTHKKGGMTSITNMENICRQLKVDAVSFKKKFFSELKRTKGLTVYDNNQFKGSHLSVADLETVLEKLIKKYLLCPKCNTPEWKDGSCSACGHGTDDTTADDTDPSSSVDASLVSSVDASLASTTHTQTNHASPHVLMAHRLYDSRLTVDEPTRQMMDKALDKFWEIPPEDNQNHEKWRVKVQEYFFK